MLSSWLGWSLSGRADCFVILPEKDPVIEGMSSPFLTLVGCPGIARIVILSSASVNEITLKLRPRRISAEDSARQLNCQQKGGKIEPNEFRWLPPICGSSTTNREARSLS
jgi:hypothetical protein